MINPSSNSPLLRRGFALGGVLERTLQTQTTPLFDQGTHEYWMEHALTLSMEAIGWSAPNPAVGCVVVKHDQVMSEGYTQAYKKEHAERMAFASLDKDSLEGATVYVTLEPCSHTGAQPPCVDLLTQSAVKTVVIACRDPDPRVNGAGIQKLKDAGKEVILGVLENECKAWHFPFLKTRGDQKVAWIAKWAQTQEGYLADAFGNSKWITNEKSRAYTHWLRQKYDAILVGSKTWIQDRPSLTVRDCALPHRRNPHRLVFDPKGELLDPRNHSTEIIYTAPVHIYVSEEVLERTPRRPEVENLFWIPIEARPEDPSFLLKFQAAVEKTDFSRPLQSVFCEGGATLLRLIMRHGRVDAVHVFTSTKTFEQNSDRYQIGNLVPESWFCFAEHNFDGDHLREWINCI